MPIVQSFGSLQTVRSRALTATWATSTPSLDWSGFGQTYALMYSTQPAVRTCVDFLARNIAQLGLHIFRRVSDTDRERLADHQLAQWLQHPNPYTTQYRLFESLIADLGIYFNAYWLKVPLTTGDIGLVRIPPDQMQIVGGLLPSYAVWTSYEGRQETLQMEQLVWFAGYNPHDPLHGLSPLETLRRRLEEEAAADAHREAYWRNASRMEGVIERPLNAPKWNPTQKQSWRDQWQARYHGPASTGTVAVLEDGMTFKPTSFSARDSEYVASRKLTREEVAAEYHIPLPMVGLLDHATFSNIKEQHKQLYADCLGPWLEYVQGVVEMQLLVDCSDRVGIYTEFNIAEKLKGSFEEQATALRALVGRPLMTPNEGRARLNLPAITDDPTADQIAPQQGGPASSLVPAADAAPETASAVTAAVRSTWTRQAARLAAAPIEQRAELLNPTRCLAELTADLTPLIGWANAARLAARVTDDTYTLLVEGADAFGPEREVPCSALV